MILKELREFIDLCREKHVAEATYNGMSIKLGPLPPAETVPPKLTGSDEMCQCGHPASHHQAGLCCDGCDPELCIPRTDSGDVKE